MNNPYNNPNGSINNGMPSGNPQGRPVPPTGRPLPPIKQPIPPVQQGRPVPPTGRPLPPIKQPIPPVQQGRPVPPVYGQPNQVPPTGRPVQSTPAYGQPIPPVQQGRPVPPVYGQPNQVPPTGRPVQSTPTYSQPVNANYQRAPRPAYQNSMNSGPNGGQNYNRQNSTVEFAPTEQFTRELSKFPTTEPKPKKASAESGVYGLTREELKAFENYKKSKANNVRTYTVDNNDSDPTDYGSVSSLSAHSRKNTLKDKKNKKKNKKVKDDKVKLVGESLVYYLSEKVHELNTDVNARRPRVVSTTRIKNIFSVLAIVGFFLIVVGFGVHIGLTFFLESTYVSYFENNTISAATASASMWNTASFLVILKESLIEPLHAAEKLIASNISVVGLSGSLLTMIMFVMPFIAAIGLILIIVNLILNVTIGPKTIKGYNKKIMGIKNKILDEIDKYNLPKDIVSVDDVNGVPDDEEFYAGDTVLDDEVNLEVSI